MATKVKPTPREALVTEFRRVIVPLMRSFGFENPPKGSPDWFGSTRLNSWVRKRDGYTDEIYIRWDKYGKPAFAISLRTDQAVRMWAGEGVRPRPRLDDVDVLAARARRLWGYDLEEEWSYRFLSVRKAVALAIDRLTEANEYLMTGRRTRHIRLASAVSFKDDDPTVDYPVFWWREGRTGEANLRLHAERQQRAEEKRQRRLVERRPGAGKADGRG